MARRRANGEGTIVRRKDGRFHAAHYVLTPEGARERQFIYGRTWDECHNKLTEMKAKTAQGVPLAVKARTLDRYLTYWLEEVAGRRLRPPPSLALARSCGYTSSRPSARSALTG
jgi:hypothetical protein